MIVQKIHHISDIQIRLLKRHREYRQVFDRLYAQLKNDASDSIIVVSGDVVHTKTELSPELVDLTHDFLKNLAEIAPTILMPGNHDCNLNNADRMDSLTPIVKGVNHPQLHYFKNSGVFTLGQLQFSIMGVFEPKEQYVKADKMLDGVKVAIFHGTVNKSMTDLGHQFLTGDIDVEFFDGFDMVLLGDIHKMQCLQKYGNGKPEVWYAGSAVQQNHGESLSHGYLTWDVETRKPKYHEVKNDYGYYTLEIRNGVPSDYSNIPDKPRMRVQVWDTDGTDVKRILADVRKTCNVQEVIVNRMDSNVSKPSIVSGVSSLDIRNVNIQNELIAEYLNRNFVLPDETIARVKAINISLNGKLPGKDYVSNLHWKADKFSFSNMFSYGGGNEIDFSQMQGTVGIFAPNATGKSSILDSLSFNIFDKSSRAFKASQILNNRKDDFDCTFSFFINDVQYFIARKASKRKYTNQIKVDVDFWYVNEFGEKVSLNGEERRSTDDVVRSYIGSYEDFVLTALSVQGSNTGFIDMGQSDRKDLLSRFLGLNVLEDLYQLGAKEISEVQTLLKDFQRQDFTAQLASAEVEREANKRFFTEHNDKKKTLSKQRDVLNEKIVELAKELILIDESILDIDRLRANRDKQVSTIATCHTELEKLKVQTDANRKEYERLQEELTKFDENEIKTQYDELVRLEEEKVKVTGQIETAKVDIKHKLAKLDKLSEHKYDPNCPFCINNVFVKDARRTEAELEKDKELVGVLVNRVVTLKQNIDELEQYRTLYDAWDEVATAFDAVKVAQLEINARASEVDGRLRASKLQLKSVEEKIAKYESMKDAVEKNKETNKEIERLKGVLSELVEEIDETDSKLRSIHGKIRVAETTIKAINESIERAKELEEEYSAYEYYLGAVKRDGVPYELISKTIPEIEQEVNNILNQVADFSIVWNLDGKNINTFIAYDESNFWPLELTSGMEKFISSVAIRVALINVSSLPRPNFLALDEGFGVLDSENVNNMHMFLDYLKQRFDFILIISHLDAMKDVVDTALEVKKDDEGFSVVQFT
jgi:DNA repair exonuclease SbcCD ATPase subunit